MDMQQTRQRAEEFIRCLHELEHGGDAALERMVALFTDEARLTNPMIRHHDDAMQGREGVRRFWQTYRESFKDVHSEFGHVMANDSAAGLFWRSQGKDVQGKPVEYEGVSLLEFDGDGRIRGFRGYFDSRAMTRALD